MPVTEPGSLVAQTGVVDDLSADLTGPVGLELAKGGGAAARRAGPARRSALRVEVGRLHSLNMSTGVASSLESGHAKPRSVDWSVCSDGWCLWLQEPVIDGVEVGVAENVAAAAEFSALCVRDRAEEMFCVSAGTEDVVRSVPDADWYCEGLQVEAPRAGHGDAVVDLSVDPAGVRCAHPFEVAVLVETGAEGPRCRNRAGRSRLRPVLIRFRPRQQLLRRVVGPMAGKQLHRWRRR
jgi:hypothetical protein